MKRWNGWGEDRIDFPLSPFGARFLERSIGPGKPQISVKFSDVVAAVPQSRLKDQIRWISTRAEDRATHACGQSLPDWIAIRSGRINAYPDAVAYPTDDQQIRELLTVAKQGGIRVIPYGGGTSVVGHINPLPGDAPVLTVDLSRMNRFLHFDSAGMLATFGAGITGPTLEAHLRAHGCTLGHFPQSFEYSTLGGWVATRSSGQESLRYGNIAQLFAGGSLETPTGTMDLPAFPASAAGPDLRHLVLGSEGRLGILTRIVVRASPLPQRTEFHTVFFPHFEQGCEAIRRIVQAKISISMLRLSNPLETTTAFAISGHESATGTLSRVLSLRGIREEKCMLLMGLHGSEKSVKSARSEALDICSSHKGFHIGKVLGAQWQKNRFRTPYLRNILWDMGYAVDSVETAVGWSEVNALVTGLETALRPATAEKEEKTHVVTHISHPYPSGANIYTTFLFRIGAEWEETLERWKQLKKAASETILAHHGTISHQHGIGIDHAAYLKAEKGESGISSLRVLCRHMDPGGIMNPGKLI